jgi:hypothetical protein
MGDVVGPAHDPPVCEQPAGADRPMEGHTELQGRLELVRPERREQRRADGVVEHGGEEGASTFPAGFVNACGAVNASSIVPASTSAARNSKPSVAAAGGTGAAGERRRGRISPEAPTNPT